MSCTRWKLAAAADAAAVRAIDEQLGTGSFAASILAARGYSVEEATDFLGDDTLPDPYTLKDMDRAVETIESALDAGDPIIIYGDYDADGVCATTLLYTYLSEREADVHFYIPKRDGEGYGLNRKALSLLHEKYGTRLLITVDNGVTAVDEIAYCRELGMQVVVTDHHQPTETLPECAAVVDPHRRDCTSGCTCLCGAGVALMLICALEHDNEAAAYYADLAAIGTVGDVVPLTGENRAIVRMGLERLTEHDRPGIEALRQVANLMEGELTAENLAFGLVPRLNAAGRMGSAGQAVNLLLSEDEEESRQYALRIQDCNNMRREIEAEILESVNQKLRDDPKLLQQRMLILSGAGWHHGVVGIVAARLVEKYGKPCVLIAIDGHEARASARSVEGFSMFQAFSAIREHLTRFGGHSMAAGFSTDEARMHGAVEALHAYAAETFRLMPAPTHTVDLLAEPSHLSLENIQSLSLLEPFGNGNERPSFVMRDLRLDAVYPMSQGKHVKLKLSTGRESCLCVWFGMTPENMPFSVGSRVDVLCGASVNEYNGETRVTIKVAEMRPTGFDFDLYWRGRQIYDRMLRRELLNGEEYALVLPDRDDIAVLYRSLRRDGAFPEDYDRLAMRNPSLPYCKLRAILEILKELRLIIVSGGRITVPVSPARVDIESSRILRRLRTMEREV